MGWRKVWTGGRHGLEGGGCGLEGGVDWREAVWIGGRRGGLEGGGCGMEGSGLGVGNRWGDEMLGIGVDGAGRDGMEVQGKLLTARLQCK